VQFRCQRKFYTFPDGYGLGDAGGILSAGIDGIKAAEAVALHILGELN
jgi:uncharacterized protein